MSTTESDLTSAEADGVLDQDVAHTEDITEERDVTSSDELDDASSDVEEADDEAHEIDHAAASTATVLDDDLLDDDVFDDDVVDDEDDSPLPEIIPATSDEPDAHRDSSDGDRDDHADAFTEVDDEEVSEQIIEELRQAAIDGPVVPYAPQDETTAARRRPRRSADYDPAPVPIPAKVPRVLGRKPRVRKVTRVVRHVDPWSVFKIALIAFIVLYVIVLTASVLLWNVANSTGTVDNVERFFESFGWNSFEFNGGELYHAGWIAGLFVVIGLTGLAVLTATLFNLITDLVGGVRVTVLEEEVVETRTSPMRRFVVRRSEPEVPAVLRDGSGTMFREAVVDDAGANDRPSR